VLAGLLLFTGVSFVVLAVRERTAPGYPAAPWVGAWLRKMRQLSPAAQVASALAVMGVQRRVRQ
jgi:hypothetical protein